MGSDEENSSPKKKSKLKKRTAGGGGGGSSFNVLKVAVKKREEVQVAKQNEEAVRKAVLARDKSKERQKVNELANSFRKIAQQSAAIEKSDGDFHDDDDIMAPVQRKKSSSSTKQNPATPTKLPPIGSPSNYANIRQDESITTTVVEDTPPGPASSSQQLSSPKSVRFSPPLEAQSSPASSLSYRLPPAVATSSETRASDDGESSASSTMLASSSSPSMRLQHRQLSLAMKVEDSVNFDDTGAADGDERAEGQQQLRRSNDSFGGVTRVDSVSSPQEILARQSSAVGRTTGASPASASAAQPSSSSAAIGGAGSMLKSKLQRAAASATVKTSGTKRLLTSVQNAAQNKEMTRFMVHDDVNANEELDRCKTIEDVVILEQVVRKRREHRGMLRPRLWLATILLPLVRQTELKQLAVEKRGYFFLTVEPMYRDIIENDERHLFFGYTMESEEGAARILIKREMYLWRTEITRIYNVLLNEMFSVPFIAGSAVSESSKRRRSAAGGSVVIEDGSSPIRRLLSSEEFQQQQQQQPSDSRDEPRAAQVSSRNPVNRNVHEIVRFNSKLSTTLERRTRCDLVSCFSSRAEAESAAQAFANKTCFSYFLLHESFAEAMLRRFREEAVFYFGYLIALHTAQEKGRVKISLQQLLSKELLLAQEVRLLILQVEEVERENLGRKFAKVMKAIVHRTKAMSDFPTCTSAPRPETQLPGDREQLPDVTPKKNKNQRQHELVAGERRRQEEQAEFSRRLYEVDDDGEKGNVAHLHSSVGEDTTNLGERHHRHVPTFSASLPWDVASSSSPDGRKQRAKKKNGRASHQRQQPDVESDDDVTASSIDDLRQTQTDKEVSEGIVTGLLNVSRLLSSPDHHQNASHDNHLVGGGMQRTTASSSPTVDAGLGGVMAPLVRLLMGGEHSPNNRSTHREQQSSPQRLPALHGAAPPTNQYVDDDDEEFDDGGGGPANGSSSSRSPSRVRMAALDTSVVLMMLLHRSGVDDVGQAEGHERRKLESLMRKERRMRLNSESAYLNRKLLVAMRENLHLIETDGRMELQASEVKHRLQLEWALGQHGIRDEEASVRKLITRFRAKEQRQRLRAFSLHVSSEWLHEHQNVYGRELLFEYREFMITRVECFLEYWRFLDIEERKGRNRIMALEHKEKRVASRVSTEAAACRKRNERDFFWKGMLLSGTVFSAVSMQEDRQRSRWLRIESVSRSIITAVTVLEPVQRAMITAERDHWINTFLPAHHTFILSLTFKVYAFEPKIRHDVWQQEREARTEMCIDFINFIEILLRKGFMQEEQRGWRSIDVQSGKERRQRMLREEELRRKHAKLQRQQEQHAGSVEHGIGFAAAVAAGEGASNAASSS